MWNPATRPIVPGWKTTAGPLLPQDTISVAGLYSLRPGTSGHAEAAVDGDVRELPGDPGAQGRREKEERETWARDCLS